MVAVSFHEANRIGKYWWVYAVLWMVYICPRLSLHTFSLLFVKATRVLVDNKVKRKLFHRYGILQNIRSTSYFHFWLFVFRYVLVHYRYGEACYMCRVLFDITVAVILEPFVGTLGRKEYHNQVYEEKTLKLKGMQYRRCKTHRWLYIFVYAMCMFNSMMCPITSRAEFMCCGKWCSQPIIMLCCDFMMYLRRESLLAIVFYIWMDCTVHRQEGALLKERVSLLHTYLHYENCC